MEIVINSRKFNLSPNETPMKITTLEKKLTFRMALQKLLDGKCIGIRPDGNLKYVVLFKPYWINKYSPDYMLMWNDTNEDSKITTNQFLGIWQLVIIDHKTL